MAVPEGMKVLNLHIDKDMHTFLRFLSVKTGKTLASMIREVLEEIKKREEAKEKNNCLVLREGSGGR